MTVSQVPHPFALQSVLLPMSSLLLAHSMSWFHLQYSILDGLLQPSVPTSRGIPFGLLFIERLANGPLHARKTELANKGAHRFSDNMTAP